VSQLAIDRHLEQVPPLGIATGPPALLGLLLAKVLANKQHWQAWLLNG